MARRSSRRIAAPSPSPRAAAAVETRVFRSGNSDAVRLPRALGMTGRRVRLVPAGPGRVLVEVARKSAWPAAWLASLGRGLTRDFTIEREAPDGGRDARDATRFDA